MYVCLDKKCRVGNGPAGKLCILDGSGRCRGDKFEAGRA